MLHDPLAVAGPDVAFAALSALIVTRLPTSADPWISGVGSLINRSVLLAPVSTVSRSPVGGAGAIVSMVNVSADEFALTLPARSVTRIRTVCGPSAMLADGVTEYDPSDVDAAIAVPTLTPSTSKSTWLLRSATP